MTTEAEKKFIECTSFNVSYNVMGIATVSYTVVHNTDDMIVFPDDKDYVEAGGQKFEGYVVNASTNRIPYTEWYETHVTYISIAKSS